MDEVAIVGVDLAKSVFQVHASNSDGRAVTRKWLPRTRFLSFMSQIKPCVVAMEACATSHYWARELIALGHEVRLIPPIYVKPFVKRQKNDANDAEAIVEAALRPAMRTVPVKSPEQQALAMLFRTRELLLTQKTQLLNALRAHLAEHGVIVAGGRRSIDPFIRVLEDMTNPLPDVVRKVGPPIWTGSPIPLAKSKIWSARSTSRPRSMRWHSACAPFRELGQSRPWLSKLSLRPWRVLRVAGISQPGSGLFLGNTLVEASSAWGDLQKWGSATSVGC